MTINLRKQVLEVLNERRSTAAQIEIRCRDLIPLSGFIVCYVHVKGETMGEEDADVTVLRENPYNVTIYMFTKG